MKPLIIPAQGAVLKHWPDGNIYQGFCEHPELYMAAVGDPCHLGIDIAMALRTPLLCSEGVVVQVKNTPNGFGEHFKLITMPDENGDCLELVYGHCDEVVVKLGDKVTDGQLGGYMGNTGFVVSGGSAYWGNAPAGRGVHVHFATRPCTTKPTKWQFDAYTPTLGYTLYIKDFENGYKGYVNPLTFFANQPNINSMRYVIDSDKNQWLVDDTLHTAWSIADEGQLGLFRAQGLTGDPEVVANLDGYKTYHGAFKESLKAFFNI